jgi:hypothetical protein
MPTNQSSFRTYYGALLKECWKTSRLFRTLLIIAMVWAVLRLGMQIVMMADPVSGQLSVDLQVYLDAAKNFSQHVNLYPSSLENLEYQFPYPPVFALLFTPFLRLPQQVIIFVHLILHILAYYAIFWRWGKIFQRWNLTSASRYLILTLPVWLFFSAFWDDLIYLNIYTVMALLGTLFIESTLKENLRGATIWLTLILITKPQWAFAAAIPLFIGNYRFFAKLIAYSLASYLVLSTATLLVGGPSYVLTQYQDYIHLLARLGRDFPWRGPESGFLGYNHSIKQIFAYLLGPSSNTLLIATITKSVLLIPLGIITIKRIFHPLRNVQENISTILELALLLYLGAFIWLDIVWEATLSIAVFAYLLSAVDRKTKVIVSTIFLPYAILDFWRLIGYLAGSPMINDAYLVSDYSIYIPTTMLVIVTFYAVLTIRQYSWKKV